MAIVHKYSEISHNESDVREVRGIEDYPEEFYNFMVMYFQNWMTHKLSPFHEELCELIKYQRGAASAPRTFGKSLILSCFYPIWLSLREPNSQIVVVSATEFLATNQIMDRIKKEFELNELLINDFGDQRSDKWRQDWLRLNNGSEIIARSVTSQIRGLHPKVIILDDSENDEEVSTVKGRDLFASFMGKRIFPTLNYEWCQLLMIGTILHPESYLNNVVLGKKPGWTSRFYRAITQDGKALWPHLYPLNRLKLIKNNSESPEAFEQEYMNNPIPDSMRTFRQEWFRYIKMSEIPKAVNRFVTVDPAIGQSDHHDDTAIVISSMDCDKNIYIEEVIYGKMIPNEIIQALFDIYERKKVLVTGIETQGFQKTLQYMFQDESRRRHKFPLIEELKSDGRRKEWRIKALQPYFQNKKIFFVEEAPGIEKLERQFLSFPTGRNDDGIDAMAYLLQLMRPAGKPKDPPPHWNSFEGVFRRLCEEDQQEDVWGNHNLRRRYHG